MRASTLLAYAMADITNHYQNFPTKVTDGIGVLLTDAADTAELVFNVNTGSSSSVQGLMQVTLETP